MKKIIDRVKSLLLKTRETWETISAEETTVSGLFKEYVFIAAAVPAAASFLGRWLIGIRIPFDGFYRFSFGGSLFNAILTYAMTLAGIWLLGMVISWLAPRFGAAKDDVRGMKVAVFTYLPFLAAGVFYLIPALSVLVVLVGIFCLYIMYIGLPLIMGIPKEKSLVYIIVIVIVLVLIYWIIGLISGAVLRPYGPHIPPIR